MSRSKRMASVNYLCVAKGWVFISMVACVVESALHPALADEFPPISHGQKGCATQEKPVNFDTGTFWRVEQDGRLVAHILGTLHIGAPEILGVPKEAYEQLPEASALVVEVAPEAGEDLHLHEMRNLPNGVRLESLLDSKSASLFRRLAKARGFHLPDLQSLRPLTALTLIQYAEYLPMRALDDHLVDRATELGIKVKGLESLEEQIKASTCLDVDEEARVLKETLPHNRQFKRISDRMIALYRSGDVGELMRYAVHAIPLSKAAQRLEERDKACLIDQRNVTLRQRLARMLGDQTLFVAVGAFHMVGSDGLLAYLQARGYQVCRAKD